MSSKQAKSAAAQAQTKEITSIPLPQFPKVDDTKVARAKWTHDYDRVQAELLRPHLADGTSATMSLRQLPDDWEEQHRHQQAQKAQLEAMRQKKREQQQQKERSPSARASHRRGSLPQLADAAGSFYKAGPRTPDRPGTNASLVKSLPSRAQTTEPTTAAGGNRGIPSRLHASTSLATHPQRSTRREAAPRREASPAPFAAASTTVPYSRLGLSPSRGGARTGSPGGAETVTSTFVASRLPNTDECARVLINLLAPTPAYMGSGAAADLRHLELGWVARYRPGDRVQGQLSLETMREDIFTNPTEGAALNSPRSALVLARNGVGVADLQARPEDYFTSGQHKQATAHNSSSLALGPPATPDMSPQQQELAKMAQRHFETRRGAMLGSLRTEYRALCREVPLLELLDVFCTLREDDAGGDERLTADVSFLQQRRERQARVRAAEMDTLERAKEMAAEQQRRVADAEERRLHAEAEYARRQEEMKEANNARRIEAEQRQAALRAATEELNEEYREKLLERRKRIESKEEQRMRLREEHREEQRRIARTKAMKREARRARQQELQERLNKELEHKRAERDEADEARRLKKEEDLALHREQLQLAQQRAEEQRIANRSAALEKEEEIKARARDKTEQASERLAEFRRAQAEEREERHAAALKKDEHRTATMVQAEDRQRERTEGFVKKAQSHEERLAVIEAERLHAFAVTAEAEREAEEDKRFYVERRTRAIEFDKLMTIGAVQRKRQRAVAVERQRNMLQEVTLRDREAARLQKEAYKEDLYRKSVRGEL